MTARTWLYGTILGSVPLVNGRIFAKKTMTSSQAEHPFIVYQMGNSTDVGFAEDTDIDRQFIQIFVHDYYAPGVSDYTLIDQVIRQLRNALNFAASPADGVVAVNYLETSQDLNDETLNTVFRYVRFQLITKDYP